MVNYNPNESVYGNMNIEDLHKELAKPGLMAEDRSLLIHTIAKKRAGNVTSLPEVDKPLTTTANAPKK